MWALLAGPLFAGTARSWTCPENAPPSCSVRKWRRFLAPRWCKYRARRMQWTSAFFPPSVIVWPDDSTLASVGEWLFRRRLFGHRLRGRGGFLGDEFLFLRKVNRHLCRLIWLDCPEKHIRS